MDGSGRNEHLAPSTTETVLIIDDDPTVLAVTKRLVESLGYKALTAHNGREGVQLAQDFEDEIDLALLDMHMPVMDGPAAFPLLRQARPEMRVLLCSGHGFTPTCRSLIESGACGFIAKPYHIAALGKEIRKALDAS